MVENIYFKVLPAGEGKTRWLVEKAFNEINSGNPVVLVTKDDEEFDKFVMYYRTLFAMYCPVRHVKGIEEIPDNAIVLIDNFMFKLEKNVFDINAVKSKGAAIFATVEGKIAT